MSKFYTGSRMSEVAMAASVEDNDFSDDLGRRSQMEDGERGHRSRQRQRKRSRALAPIDHIHTSKVGPLTCDVRSDHPRVLVV